MKFLLVLVAAVLLLEQVTEASHGNRCLTVGVKCLSDTAFMVCNKKSQKLIKAEDGLNCPEKHLCQEDESLPCVPDLGVTCSAEDEGSGDVSE